MKKKKQTLRPLADLLRPETIDDVVGQDHLLAQGKPIGRMLALNRLSSLILWGPPGSGKTTIARLLASAFDAQFDSISAVFAGKSELKVSFQRAVDRYNNDEKSVLFVDEIHRFNRAQQDSFLPYIEDGRIILIGATTENPSFELNSALLSRLQVFILKQLETDSLKKILNRAEQYKGRKCPIENDLRERLCGMSDGDGRYLLNLAEELLSLPTHPILKKRDFDRLLQNRRPLYDKNRDVHFNLISAFHKSLRGSDVDASLYWLARMLEVGEDPRYITRRLIRFASEDIGVADPQSLTCSLSAAQSYERLGSPEGLLSLFQATIYLATAPKSNSVYLAQNSAILAAKKYSSLSPPKHILNPTTKLLNDEGYGNGYKYDHDILEKFSGQNYFPDNMNREKFYNPGNLGFEKEIQKRLKYWSALRKKTG